MMVQVALGSPGVSEDKTRIITGVLIAYLKMRVMPEVVKPRNLSSANIKRFTVCYDYNYQIRHFKTIFENGALNILLPKR